MTLSNVTISKTQAVSMRLTGFSSILVALFLYKKTTELPGVAALLPVLGTCLLLFSSNSRQDIIYKALTLTPVRFVGNISYSLYLWHWPLLVFARLMWSDLTRLDTVIALLIAVVLAMMTTYSFENPIRDRKILKSNHALLIVSGFTLLLIFVMMLSTVGLKGMPWRWNHKDLDLQSIQYDFDDAFDVGHCFIDERHTLSVLLDASCLKPQQGKVNVLIIGDSFAAHLMPGLKYHFPEIHFNQATASACRALHGFGDRNFRKNWPCPNLNQLLFSESFLANQKYSAIVLASDWQYGYDGKLDGLALLETTNYLKKITGIPVIVLGNTPVYKRNTNIILRSHTLSGYSVNNSLIFRDGLLEMETFNKNKIKSATFISMLDQFCDDSDCPVLTEDNKRVHFGIHLTEWGAIEVIGAVKNKLNTAFSSLNSLNNE